MVKYNKLNGIDFGRSKAGVTLPASQRNLRDKKGDNHGRVGDFFMSKLLFNTVPLVVDRELACILGLNEAIVLQQIHYWIENNKKMGKNYHDGRYWTYNTYEQWQTQFPFWCSKTLFRLITSLETKGLLLVGNYNTLKIDRTKWYTINYDKLDALQMGEGDGEVEGR